MKATLVIDVNINVTRRWTADVTENVTNSVSASARLVTAARNASTRVLVTGCASKGCAAVGIVTQARFVRRSATATGSVLMPAACATLISEERTVNVRDVPGLMLIAPVTGCVTARCKNATATLDGEAWIAAPSIAPESRTAMAVVRALRTPTVRGVRTALGDGWVPRVTSRAYVEFRNQ